METPPNDDDVKDLLAVISNLSQSVSVWIEHANSRQLQIDALTKQLTEANDLIDMLQNDIDAIKKENAELRRSTPPGEQQLGRILRGGSRAVRIVNVDIPCAMDNID
jgi:chromosome segregation ATPase